jgi:replicative DNA helicase
MPIRKAQPQGQGRGSAPSVSESEQAALGAAIRDSDSCELVLSELATEDFYTGTHQKVFNAIRSLSEEQLTPNPVSVAERAGVPKSSVEDLLAASAGVSRSVLQTVASDIRRVGALRRIYEACSNTASQVSRDSKLEEVVELLESGLYKANRDGQSEAADGSATFMGVVEDFLRRHREGGGPELSTGLRDLDRALCGLRPGKMGVIAARPSMGKTALASTIRRSVLAQGYGVIEFNLEMSKEELMERELAFQAQMNLSKVMKAKDVTNDELDRVNRARGLVVPGRWYVDDSTYSIAGMRRKARILSGRMARQGVKTGAVVVDYIQLAGENGDGREQSIAAVSRGCKFLAKELGCTVLALSQLNRSCEYREDRRPLMSDLRESGAIEQDADWVGFVYRESLYDHSYPPEDTEFIIRKQRSGPVGTIRLRYHPKNVVFTDFEPTVNTNTPLGVN